MRPITIKTFNNDFVFQNNRTLFNSNNHPETPSDYNEKLSATMTKNWVDAFHTNYRMITLDASDVKWLKQAFEQGTRTGRWPHDYDDELDAICAKYPFPEGSWFVRTDYVSLKEGFYGMGPYNNLRNIIVSIVTTRHRHRCIQADDVVCNIYLFPWKTIDPDREFRVFVYQNTITAISIQKIFDRNTWLVNLDTDTIENIVHTIDTYFEEEIKDKLRYLGTYTYDFVLSDTGPYFIEPNCFGRHYAAGSALFHWIYDHDVVHDKNEIEFRYSI
jgi:hypothetical protein